jgi:hypothetical protein
VLGAIGYFLAWESRGSIEAYVDFNLRLIAVEAVVIVACVALVEWFLPAARVPAGHWFRAVRGHRIGTAALQGAAAGATAGFAVFVVMGGMSQVDGSVIPWLVLSPAVGFAIAEGILIRRQGDRR